MTCTLLVLGYHVSQTPEACEDSDNCQGDAAWVIHRQLQLLS